MISYAEFQSREQFEKAELLAFAYGRLVSDSPEHFVARLPTPPMLMVDRILEISAQRSRGRIVAERDVHLDDWFFQCHFQSDPVQPGCLGLDGVWQMLGFYCNWRGGLGSGRALGCGEVEFFGQIRPHDAVVRYEIDVRRFTIIRSAGASMVIGDARVLVDDEDIYRIAGGRVGLFRNFGYPGYPLPSEHSERGRLERCVKPLWAALPGGPRESGRPVAGASLRTASGSGCTIDPARRRRAHFSRSCRMPSVCAPIWLEQKRSTP